MKYYYTSLTANTLANGKPLAFDDQVELTDDEAGDDHNAALIDAGHLVPLEEQSKSANKKEE